jgi:hypothetical protein
MRLFPGGGACDDAPVNRHSRKKRARWECGVAAPGFRIAFQGFFYNGFTRRKPLRPGVTPSSDDLKSSGPCLSGILSIVT